MSTATRQAGLASVGSSGGGAPHTDPAGPCPTSLGKNRIKRDEVQCSQPGGCAHTKVQHLLPAVRAISGGWGQEEKKVPAPMIQLPRYSGTAWFSCLPDAGCNKPVLALRSLPLDVVPRGGFAWTRADFCTELACTYEPAEQINYVGTKLRL